MVFHILVMYVAEDLIQRFPGNIDGRMCSINADDESLLREKVVQRHTM